MTATSVTQLMQAVTHQRAMLKREGGCTEKQKQAAKDRYKKKKEQSEHPDRGMGRPRLTVEERRAKLAALEEALARARAEVTRPPPNPSESLSTPPP